MLPPTDDRRRSTMLKCCVDSHTMSLRICNFKQMMFKLGLKSAVLESVFNSTGNGGRREKNLRDHLV